PAHGPFLMLLRRGQTAAPFARSTSAARLCRRFQRSIQSGVFAQPCDDLNHAPASVRIQTGANDGLIRVSSVKRSQNRPVRGLVRLAKQLDGLLRLGLKGL